MTQRLDKLKKDKVRGPNSKLVTNGPEAQNENKHSSPDKIGRLHLIFHFSRYTAQGRAETKFSARQSNWLRYN